LYTPISVRRASIVATLVPWVVKLGIAAVTLLSIHLPFAKKVEASGQCTFLAGFKSLHDAIPSVVGTCTSDEQPELTNIDGSTVATGNRLQHTSRGLLIWRRADNSASFTDGYRTWVVGPQGLEQRLNSEHLPWEIATDDSTPLTSSRQSELLRLLNDDRRNNGLPALILSPGLTAVAQLRSREMAQTGKLSHYDDSGDFVSLRLIQSSRIPYLSAAENIAEMPSPEVSQVHQIFMRSSPHRANILEGDFDQVGIGVAGPVSGGVYYYAELFVRA
jgi:uncharacterized protein YkwD